MTGPKPGPPPPSSESLSDLRVLLVDDDSAITEMCRVVLGHLGVRTVQDALSGAEALEKLDHGSDATNMVLCDLNMPGMDGLEFLRRLAERQYAGAVVLVSGEDERILATSENLARRHGLNVVGTLMKPIEPSDLQTILDLARKGRAKAGSGQVLPITAPELDAGIRGQELVVFFQPKVETLTGRVTGAEALVRWQHASRGLLGPMSFVPLAEESGLIDALTSTVLEKSMLQLAAWQKAGFGLRVAVNVSTDNLNRLDLPEFIVKTADRTGADISGLILEVTESRLIENISMGMEVLTRLRLKGVGLSIDDFGTGYSSLEQLRHIPFMELKIDRSFVGSATSDSTAKAILESSIGLAKKLRMAAVAEGVETESEWKLVAEMGCDLAQGYFIAKPMPAAGFGQWFSAWKGFP